MEISLKVLQSFLLHFCQLKKLHFVSASVKVCISNCVHSALSTLKITTALLTHGSQIMSTLESCWGSQNYMNVKLQQVLELNH